MNADLSIEQRFALTRARYEVTKMSRPALERTALRLLKSRMEQKNGVQEMLMANGIIFKIDEQQGGLPEIISEQTFVDLLELNVEGADEMPQDPLDTADLFLAGGMHDVHRDGLAHHTGICAGELVKPGDVCTPWNDAQVCVSSTANN